MSHACTPAQSLWHTLLSSKVGFVFVVTLFSAFLSHSSAQIQDVTPPILAAFSFTPTTIDTATGPAVVTVSLSATDDLTDVTFMQAIFSSPSGLHHINPTPSFTPAPSVSATTDVSFPQLSEIGTWTVIQLFLQDTLGNTRRYTTTELAQLGFPTELVVEGQEEDVTPPAITVSATPATLWPPNGSMVSVTISGTITDDESGVNASTAAFEVKDEYGLIQPSGQITTLDATTGSYTFRIQLQASRNNNDGNGRQYIIIVSAQDNEGNQGSNSTVVTVSHNQR